MGKNIYILSASDRYNYGDLLFPHIVIKELSLHGDYTFTNISTTKSNLTKYGALKTKSYSLLYKSNIKDGVLWIAGGEVLGANWSRLISFLNPFYFYIYSKTSRKDILESLTKRLFGKKENPIPFVPIDNKLTSKYNIIFNAVGGTGLSNHYLKHEITSILKKALYLSLREKASFNDIKNNLAIEQSRLKPDSAILMSKHFNTATTTEEYISFQIGRYKTGADLSIIKIQLENISRKTGYSIHLLPIGNCPGHDDNVPLKWLYSNLNCKAKYINPVSINHIMSDIANAKLFIGTSLHGIITAMSFSVPYLGINPNVQKLKFYLETWAHDDLKTIVPVESIENVVEKALAIKKEELTIIANEQINLAEESFIEIHSLLNKSCPL